MGRGRILIFEQITDSRSMKRKDCLPVLEERVEKIKKLLDIEDVSVDAGEPRLIVWGDKEKEGKNLTPYQEKHGYDSDSYHIQYRVEFLVRKNTRKTTWNDIYGLVNSVKAVPYTFL
jgi:hypothetical protein